MVFFCSSWRNSRVRVRKNRQINISAARSNTANSISKRVHDGFSLRPTDGGSIPQRKGPVARHGRGSAHAELRFAQRRQQVGGGAAVEIHLEVVGAKSGGVLPSIKLGSWRCR